MSTETPQQQAASQTAAWQAALSQQLAGVALPELQSMMGPGGQVTSLLEGTQGGTQKSALDQQAYQSALSTLGSSYTQAGRTSAESLGYQGLRSGEGRRSPGAMSSAIGSAASALDKDRMSALRNLEFSSARSSMTDYNKLLQLMGQGTQTALGLAQGFSGASGSAISGMSNWSDMNTAQTTLGVVGSLASTYGGLVAAGAL